MNAPGSALRWIRAACAAAGLALLAQPAAALCRQALALALDISGSVDAGEYRLQIDGLAAALEDPNVIDAFLAMPDAPVWLYVFEWAGLGTQRTLIAWSEVTTAEQLQGIAARLRNQPRQPREVATALGRAMEFGADALAARRDCWKLTLDISGDGRSNIGVRPRELGSYQNLAGVIVNALIIGSDPEDSQSTSGEEIPKLESYFRAEVIRGPDAFVVTANGFEDYQRAMTRKLLREIEVLAVGQATPRR